MLFDAIVNRMVFLIPPSDHLLLGYRNAIDFCILTLYPVNLLNSFISSNFLVESLGFSIYGIMSFEHNEGFTSFFLIRMPFIYFFSSLIAVTVTSDTMLNRSADSGLLFYS